MTEYNTDGTPDFGGASVNELGSGRGPVATYAYGDAGQHYLSVNSECDWQVVVVTAGAPRGDPPMATRDIQQERDTS